MVKRESSHTAEIHRNQDIEKTQKRLHESIDTIEQIRKTFQAPSIAVGVLHHNQVIFEHGFGVCDLDSGRVPDAQTLFSIGSCTKSFTSTGLDLLIQEGHFQWKTPISQYLPEFEYRNDPIIREQLSLWDALTHSTGLSSLLFAVVGKFYDVFAEANKVISACNVIPKVHHFRSFWQYSNWMYALASRITSKFAKESWGKYISRKVLKPLRLERSYVGFPVDDNYARGYVSLEDGSHEPAQIPTLVDGDAFDGSGSIRSCVKDLLTWTKHLIAASYRNDALDISTDQGEMLADSDAGRQNQHLYKALWTIQQPGFPLSKEKEQTYGLGLFVLNLPTPQISTVTNANLSPPGLIVGQNSAPRRAIGHTGALGSFVSAYWTFPDSRSAVVVLVNTSLGNGDTSNVVAQTIMQALFDMKPRVNFACVATEIVANARREWRRTVEDWHAARKTTRTQHSLVKFVGDYDNENLGITLSITLRHGLENFEGQPTELQLQINRLKKQTFQLFNYNDDVWSFMPETRDDCVRRGYEAYVGVWQGFNIRFENLPGDRFDKIVWRMGENGAFDDISFVRV